MAMPNSAVAAQASYAQPFYADSGESCPLGYSEGTLFWQAGGPGVFPVEVTGVVVDGNTCGTAEDNRYTIASFTGYYGDKVVDTAEEKVDNGQLKFDFVLGEGSSTAAGIDGVVVQVCRAPLFGEGMEYCGKPQAYSPPPVVTPR